MQQSDIQRIAAQAMFEIEHEQLVIKSVIG